MANAYIKQPEPVPPPKVYVLEMNEAEAWAVHNLCIERIGSRRVERVNWAVAGLEAALWTALTGRKA